MRGGERMRARDEQTPLALPAAAALAGAWYGGGVSPEIQRACAAGAVALALAALLAMRRRRAAIALVALAGALGLAAGARAGRAASALMPPSLAEAVSASEREELPVEVVGHLASPGEISADRVVLTVDVRSVTLLGRVRDATGRVRLAVRRTSGEPVRSAILDAGREVRAWARLAAPTGVRNPGGWDEAAHLGSQGIAARGNVKSDRLMTIGERRSRGLFRDLCHSLRRAALAKLRAAFDDADPRSAADAGLLGAFLLGDRSGLAEVDVEAFLAGGTYHILAISGLHVAIAASLVLRTLALLGRPGYRGRYVLVAAAVILYVGVAEAPPSALRAGLAGVAAAAGTIAGERVRALPLLCLAMVASLVADPLSIHDVGFQLTYAATAGIVLLGLPGGPVDGALAWLPGWLRRPLAITLAAQLATLPLIHATFFRLVPGGLLVNLVAVPASAVAMGAGVAGLLVPGSPGEALLGIAAWFLRQVATLSSMVGSAPWLSYHAAAPGHLLPLSLGALLAIAAFLADPGSFVGHRPRGVWVGSLARLGVGVAIAVAVLLHHVVGATGSAPDELEVTLLDVGQGDAIVVRDRSGRTVLVDAGGDPEGVWDVGRQVVLPGLLALGARRVDLLVLTHAHPDHGGGLPAILESLPVGELWEAVPPLDVRPGGFYARIRELATRKGVPCRRVASGDSMGLDGGTLSVRGPGSGREPSSRVRNDDSIVLELRSGGAGILLTGDVEAPAEREIAPVLAPLDVLKVAHHGSDTSTTPELLAAVRPRIAIISVGRRNLWGFPREKVLERLARSIVLRTDRDGAVTLVLRDDGLEATTARSRSLGGGTWRFPERMVARDPATGVP